MGGPDPGGPDRTTFQKRSKTVLKKADELATFCGADVYLIIDHPRATMAYNSVRDRHWPPPDEFLVNVLKPKSNQFQVDKVPGKLPSSSATNSSFQYEQYACGNR